MEDKIPLTYTAFLNTKKIAHGDIISVAVKSKTALQEAPKESLLIFDNRTGRAVDVDLRGTEKALTQRLEEQFVELKEEKRPSGPGRPRLGVQAKEVTLLPEHWEWLAAQPGGASVTLRKLVELARKKNSGRDLLRQRQEAAYRFMTTMAGDLPGYEEALRAMYAKDEEKFSRMISGWPKDVRKHTVDLLAGSWSS